MTRGWWRVVAASLSLLDDERVVRVQRLSLQGLFLKLKARQNISPKEQHYRMDYLVRMAPSRKPLLLWLLWQSQELRESLRRFQSGRLPKLRIAASRTP